MKFIPKLFNTEMVIALLNDTKNQTRRTKGLEKLTNHYFQSLVHHATGQFTFVENGNYNPTEDDVIKVNPPANIGDVLWVRETFVTGLEMYDGSFVYDEHGDYKHKTWYKADNDLDNWYDGNSDFPTDKIPWKPSLFMPKQACRLFLEVTEITVEQLNNISESDAINEGIEVLGYDEGTVYKDYINLHSETNDPILSYHTLWQKINGINSWNKNPWVWVIKFKKIDKPESFI
jgi:hypothetical protein